MERFEDPNDEGNSDKYHTGRLCIEDGCDLLAGTAWAPFWCFEHNVERMKRIDESMTNILAQFDELRSAGR